MVVIFFPLSALIYFPIQEKYLEYQALEKMESSALQALVLAKCEIVWEEKGKELILDNVFYDVKKMEHFGDSVKIFVLEDNKEKELYALRKRLDAQQDSKENCGLERIIHLIYLNNATLVVHIPAQSQRSCSNIFAEFTDSLQEGIVVAYESPPWLAQATIPSLLSCCSLLR